MRIAQTVIIPAENCDGICDIGLSGSHHVHPASNHRLGSGRIACFYVGFPLVKFHCLWRCMWPGHLRSELRKDIRNVAVLLEVDHFRIPIAFDAHTEMEWDTLEIMHPEPLFDLVLDLPSTTSLEMMRRSVTHRTTEATKSWSIL